MTGITLSPARFQSERVRGGGRGWRRRSIKGRRKRRRKLEREREKKTDNALIVPGTSEALNN